MSQLFTSGGQSLGASSFNISPSNDYTGLISFRIDWLERLSHTLKKPQCLQFLRVGNGPETEKFEKSQVEDNTDMWAKTNDRQTDKCIFRANS